MRPVQSKLRATHPDIQQTRRFLFINSSGHSYYSPFHGKAIALAIDDHYAPFPALFIVHKIRVRQNGRFVADIQVLDGCPWQILADGLFDNDSQTFRREFPPGDYLPTTLRPDVVAGSSVQPGP